MDPESKKLLESTLSLTEENNEMLHKIRGVQKRETLWRVLRLFIIVGIAFGAFYFLEPYLNKVMDLYSSVTGMQQKISDSPLNDLLKKF